MIVAISGVLAAWLAALIVGVALLAAAGAAALPGKCRLRKARQPVPEETAGSVKADVEVIKKTATLTRRTATTATAGGTQPSLSCSRGLRRTVVKVASVTKQSARGVRVGIAVHGGPVAFQGGELPCLRRSGPQPGGVLRPDARKVLESVGDLV